MNLPKITAKAWIYIIGSTFISSLIISKFSNLILIMLKYDIGKFIFMLLIALAILVICIYVFIKVIFRIIKFIKNEK